MDSPMPGFGERHFADAQFGDRRLTNRLVKIADLIHRHPSGGLPAKMQTPADIESLYRFANNPKVSHAKILAPHRAVVWEQARTRGRTIYVLYDTTELDFSGLKSNPDLGPIGGGYNRGFLCHNGLAVDAETGECLGLVSQLLALRPKANAKETRAQKRQRADRESRLWVKGTQQAGPAPEGVRVIDVADRGADTFEFLDSEVSQGRLVLVRSQHNRHCFQGHSGESGEKIRLHDHLRTRPAQATRAVAISAKAGRAARIAQTSIAWVKVRLRSPSAPRGEHGKDPLEMTAIRVWEENPPPGVKGLEWFLLTNVPVNNAAEAVEMVKAYEMRWIVEEYHKGMKTGVQMEESQFRTGAALEAVIAVQSVVAVALLQMRDLSRLSEGTGVPARNYVPESWVAMLSLWQHGETRNLTVRDFLLTLGRLGGYQNRKADAMPGWQTLWRGTIQLQAMLAGAACRDKEISDEF